MFRPLSTPAPLALPWTPSFAGTVYVAAPRAVAANGRSGWLSAFIQRFSELRPHEDEDSVLALASDLWTDLGGHDPLTCAEMESEARSFAD